MNVAADVLASSSEHSHYDPPISSEHHALLEVVCSARAGFRPRLESWLDTVDIKNLDGSSYRLYPFLAERLAAWDPSHPLLGFFRGNSRKTFYTNNLLFRRAAERFAQLQKAGIPVLILKGAALIHARAYRTGLRPMADIDFLIPTDSLGPALEILTPLQLEAAEVEALRDFQHGQSFTDALGFEYDLHWHAMPQCCDHAERNQPFWDGSEEISFSGVPVRCLNPTDSLLHVCVHGIQWNPVPPIRWIPDVLNLLEHQANAIDWSRMAWLAAELRCTLLLLLALRFLKRRFAAPISAGAFSLLEQNEIERLEEVSLPLAFHPWGGHLPWSLAEPVLREQIRVQSQRYPGRPLVVPLEKDHWTPQQSQLVEELGGIPFIRASSLPREWAPAVEQHLQQQWPQLMPTLIAFHTEHPGMPATFSLELSIPQSGPQSGLWRVVIQSNPQGNGQPPSLRVAEVQQSPFDSVPPDALLLDATSCFLRQPFPGRLPGVQQMLKHHNSLRPATE